MKLNPFYWLRILVGELVMLTSGTWIGSHHDDHLPDGDHLSIQARVKLQKQDSE